MAGSALMASRTTIQAPGDSRSDPIGPKAVVAAPSTAFSSPAPASARSAPRPFNRAGSIGSSAAARLTGRVTRVSVKPRSPWASMVMSRKARKAADSATAAAPSRRKRRSAA